MLIRPRMTSVNINPLYNIVHFFGIVGVSDENLVWCSLKEFKSISIVICEAIIITYAQSHDTEQIYEANLFFSKLWCNQSLEA